MDKIPVSILGATGMVGQNYVNLLANHPWFEIVDVAASPRSSGKLYQEAVADKWYSGNAIPQKVRELKVRDVRDFENLPESVKCVFSGMDLENKDDTRKLEFEYAERGYPFISNSSANRWTDDVPIFIPEINHSHTSMIEIQQRNRGFEKGGFVISKPNCSIQAYLTAIFALEQAGFTVDQLIITTLQALSGGGYKTIHSKEMINNVIPFIGGEEAKTEKEPLKVFGSIGAHGILLDDHLKISATCTRVPVLDGHMAVVNIKFTDRIPTRDEMLDIWQNYRSLPQELDLPSAPLQPIIYVEEENRPQPLLDAMNDKGMAVTVGRLREDEIFDYKFVALSHNTIRGAAGGAILTAELLVEKGIL
ncbi:MAG: aspartate-semialdehyde dehydrogenase [Candidatus Marinimicrobia bacterium]|nr:aspartate-semialdehyde dehydrogenase [Candidatus Neomarinimicrobiota bacterium]